MNEDLESEMYEMMRTEEQKREHEQVQREDLARFKANTPAELFEFIKEHEYDFATDRKKAVYSCRLEDFSMIEGDEEDRQEWIRYAISWAEFVQDFGDYETREEFHHGTAEAWAYEIKKSNEWINLLKVWAVSP